MSFGIVDIGIIGTGEMGRALGSAWAERGHRVFFGSRNRDRGRLVADEVGRGALGGSAHEAAEFASMVLLAVPWLAVRTSLEAVADRLAGKVLIDCTNPLVSAHKPLLVGRTTSGAEQIRELVPRAHVVKAFNAIASRVIASGDPMFDGHRANIFVCGDDEQSRSDVASLTAELGFEPVDVGVLSSARYLEPLAALSVLLDVATGPHFQISFQLLRRRGAGARAARAIR